MKISRYHFLALLFMLCFGTITAQAGGCPRCPKPKGFTECEKTYIQPAQIDFVQDEIYINLENNIVQTSAIHSDEVGLYFKDFRKQGNCADGEWECQICHDCTPNYYIYCKTCWN